MHSDRQRIALRTTDEVTSRLIGVGRQLQDAWHTVDDGTRLRLEEAIVMLDAAIAALPHVIFPQDLGPSATTDE